MGTKLQHSDTTPLAAGCCPSDEQVLAFIEGQLPSWAAECLEQHFARCASCRRLIARLGRAIVADPTLICR